MKRLYLVRHAKSSWKDPQLDDYDRPLNKRGKKDAPIMGRRLRRAGVRPDRVLSSPARRAADTASLFSVEIGYREGEIQWLAALYGAGSERMLDIIRSLDDSLDQVMLVGHNPGLTEFAERLTGTAVDNIPTAGVFAIEFEVGSWHDVRDSRGRTVFFDFPKKRSG